MPTIQGKRKTSTTSKFHTAKDVEDVSKPNGRTQLTPVRKFSYKEDLFLNEYDDRLNAGHHNPCVLDVKNIFDCRKKNDKICEPEKQPNEDLITPTVIHLEMSESYADPIRERHFKCLYQLKRKRPPKITRGTQTLYRESSMQTLPYLPDISNDKETLKNLELYKLPKILKGDGPPGLWEVEILERARKRWAYEKAFNEKFKKALKSAHSEIARKRLMPHHKAVIEAFEWEDWLEREERIQGCQMMRFQLVLRIFEKRERCMRQKSEFRMQKSCEQIIQKRDAALRQNDIEYGREMRRLKIKHEKRPRNWRKEKISDQLGDPTSEYYAPQMRYGVNPNRRHFQLSRKAFEMRMEDLEKRAVDMKNLECPFAKIKQWAKPKIQVPEVEQNFCSEANLKKLYEGLKGLREQSKKQKIVPKCLIEKTVKAPEEDLFVVEEEEEQVEELEIYADEEFVPETDDEATQVGSCHSQNSLIEMFSQRNIQRYSIPEMLNQRRLEELENMLAEYEGSEIGWLMRFLAEEMNRLKEQRKLHFITMLAQKERWRREAAEAGLRQKENEMRKIYEEIFEETNQANTDVCEQYLDNIFGIDTQEKADFEAIESTTALARVIDADLQRWLTSFEPIQNPLNYDSLRCLLRDLVFPDNMAECLVRKYETQSIIDYIIDDVLFKRVNDRLEPIEIAGVLTNAFVDRLIDNDLYIFTPECSSGCDCEDACECDSKELEAKAILRKLIRYAVPGRRWRTETERIAAENVNDVIDDVCGSTELTKRCFFKPNQKIKQRCISSITHVPSTFNFFNGASTYTSENDLLLATTSSATSSDDILDMITVISYSKSHREKYERKMGTLTQTEKPEFEDTGTLSESNIEDIRSYSQRHSESNICGATLREARSTLDVSTPSKAPHKIIGTDDETTSQMSESDSNIHKLLRMSKKSNDLHELEDLRQLTQNDIANIINRVINYFIPPDENEIEMDNEEEDAGEEEMKKKIKVEIVGKKSTKIYETYSNNGSEIYEMPIETDVLMAMEETLPIKQSEFDMVMYEAELANILFDDDDECKCQEEIDYKNYIQELHDKGRIKIIFKQDILDVSKMEQQDSSDKEYNAADLTFEYTTSFVEPDIAADEQINKQEAEAEGEGEGEAGFIEEEQLEEHDGETKEIEMGAGAGEETVQQESANDTAAAAEVQQTDATPTVEAAEGPAAAEESKAAAEPEAAAETEATAEPATAAAPEAAVAPEAAATPEAAVEPETITAEVQAENIAVEPPQPME